VDKLRRQLGWSLAVVALALGLILRLWQINTNQFLFYDEGMYLGYNRRFLDLVAVNPPKDLHEFFIILGLMTKAALGTAKSLWFLLLNLRVFSLGSHAWYFARIVSAVSGIATIILTYLFAHRYFQSKKIALMSVVFLSLLPSHVFYSRLGMQESFSTLLFLGGLYVYLFNRTQKWSSFVSAFLLVGVFLTNYRMIIAPVFIVTIEIFESFKNRESIHWQRLILTVATFFVVVFVIGSLYGGINRYVTFGWMSHQAQEAQGQKSLISIFSYPVYICLLEGVLFSLIFWTNVSFVLERNWSKLLPFVLVLVQMGGFTFAAEKGVRYLCVVLPLMAMAAAVAAEYFLNMAKEKKFYVAGFIVLACLAMTVQSFKIMNSKNDYAQAVQMVLEHDPKAGILSTQSLVEQLFVDDENQVKECPKNLGDVIELYKQGYHYLILDPQVYISWTKDGQRFSPPMIDFLQSIYDHVPPVAVLNHLDPVLLRRFVLDHNQNILQSLKFLRMSAQNEYGQIRIYNLGQALMFLKQQASETTQR
jgi:hypothetical protein